MRSVARQLLGAAQTQAGEAAGLSSAAAAAAVASTADEAASASPGRPPSSLELLAKHYLNLSSSGQGVEAEFKYVQKQGVDNARLTPTTSHVQAKNRYGNILTYEDTRVRLQGRGGNPGDDYINASQVRGWNGTYIVAQAPIPSTIADFWTLVWEQRVPIIIMLTPFEESQGMSSLVEKSSRYFPLQPGGHAQHGKLSITCVSMESDLHNVSHRVLRLSMQGVDEVREIRHVHMDTWPDFGRTDTLLPIIDLTRLMKEEVADKGGVPLVHCSAGIGRSGTFVAIAEAVEGLPGEPHAQLPNLVLKLREQRMGMVQTVSQYEMVYEAVVATVTAR